MNPRARFGGGKVSKVKGYSGKDGSAVSSKQSQKSEAKLQEALKNSGMQKQGVQKQPYPYELPESVISGMPDGKEMQDREAARLEEENKKRIQRRMEREKKEQEFDAEYERYKRWKANEGQEEKDTIRDVGSAIVSGVKSLGSKAVDVAEKAGAASKDLGSKLYNKVTGKKEETEETEGMKKGGSVKKNWIKDAIKKPGALRQSLKVKEGEKIPAKKLAAAAKKPGKTGQRARLAQTLQKFSKGGGIESRGKTRCKIV